VAREELFLKDAKGNYGRNKEKQEKVYLKNSQHFNMICITPFPKCYQSKQEEGKEASHIKTVEKARRLSGWMKKRKEN